MSLFDTVYSKALYTLFETPIRKVGFFPGCFSPPHKGHYITAKAMAEELDIAYVVASDICRSPITLEQMNAIWKIYVESMGLGNLKVKVVSASPVTAVYQAINLLNNKGKLITPKPAEAGEAALDIYKEIGGDNYEVHLFAGKEDIGGRYGAFFKDGDSIYKGKSVLNIFPRGVQRVASGTETRNTIGDVAVGVKDVDTVRQLLPGPASGTNGISSEQEDAIVNILVPRSEADL